MTGLHPEALFQATVQLAGELATFSQADRRPPAFPVYRHDRLKETFTPVIEALRLALSRVADPGVVSIPLEERKYGLRVALVADRSLFANATFVLAVRAQVSTETLLSAFGSQVKIGAVEKIRDLVNLQLPGIGLRALPVAPRQLAVPCGLHLLRTRRQERRLASAQRVGWNGAARRRRVPGPDDGMLGHPSMNKDTAMTNDTDPTIDDSDFLDAARTIVMPTPGLRRERPAAAKAAAAPPALAPLDATLAGRNPLLRAANPLLELALPLRRLTSHPDLEALRTQLIQMVRTFETNGRAFGVPDAQLGPARYCLCTFIDESIAATPWGAGVWGRRSLLVTFHNEASGGERLFVILQRLAQSPAVDIDLLD